MYSSIVNKKQKHLLKSIIIFSLLISTVVIELLLRRQNFSLPLTLSSIFLFIIIGITSKNTSLIIITVLNIILFTINDFNILSSIEAAQIYFIWFLYQHNKKNILLYSIFFGVLIVLPLLLATTYINSETTDIHSLFIILMIFLNKVFNALISDITLEYISLKEFVSIPNSYKKKLTLSNLLTYTLISSILIPIIIFITFTTFNTDKEITDNVLSDLKLSSEYLNEKIESWSDEEQSNLKLNNPIQISKLTDILKLYVSSSDKFFNYYLVDFNNKVITNKNNIDYTSQGTDWITYGSICEISPNFYKWTAPYENSYIIKNYAKEIAYIYETSIADSKVLITISSSQYTSTIIAAYLDSLKILIPLSLFLGVFMTILKNIILNSISKVINVSNNLPEKLEHKESIVFENSNIVEIDSLIFNFKSMIDNLSSMIIEAEITNKKLEESRKLLFRQANFDYLTELPNRQFFIEHAQKTIDNFYTSEMYKDKNGVAILFLDLDKFKYVNDTLGHSTGDKLLKIIAKRMTNVTGNYDSSSILVARLGGDEFVIQLVYNNKNEIEELANKIIDIIKKPVYIDNNIVNVGVSIGVGLYPDDGQDIESIFIKSDTAMYKAKSSGGNEVFI